MVSTGNELWLESGRAHNARLVCLWMRYVSTSEICPKGRAPLDICYKWAEWREPRVLFLASSPSISLVIVVHFLNERSISLFCREGLQVTLEALEGNPGAIVQLT